MNGHRIPAVHLRALFNLLLGRNPRNYFNDAITSGIYIYELKYFLICWQDAQARLKYGNGDKLILMRVVQLKILSGAWLKEINVLGIVGTEE